MYLLRNGSHNHLHTKHKNPSQIRPPRCLYLCVSVLQSMAYSRSCHHQSDPTVTFTVVLLR